MAIYNKWSPVIRDGLPDYPKGDSRWSDWRKEQKHYVLNGYDLGSERITGHYYYHLNFSKLMLLDKDDYEILASPYHVDVYKEITDIIEHCIKVSGKDFFCWKARDKGWSQLMASICCAETQFRKDNTIATLFPKGENILYKEKFYDKYIANCNALPDCMRHSANPKKNSQDLIHYGWEETDPDTGRKEFKGINSTISFSKVVNKNVLKSVRAKYIFIDEVGEIDILKPLIQANQANTRKGFKKFGMTIMGGTANSENKGYDDIFEIWHNVERYNFEKYLLPYQKALFGFEKSLDGTQKLRFIDEDTGESLIQKAFDEHINPERKKEEAKGEKAYNEYRQNHPIDETDAFLLSAGSPFSSEKTSEQRNEILTNKTIQDAIDVGNLYETVEDGKVKVKFKHNANGRWKILMHPNTEKVLNVRDVAAVDGYKYHQAEYSDSKGAIMVYRPFQGGAGGEGEIGNLPTIIYHHRPAIKQDFYRDCLLTAMYANVRLLYEYTDDDFFTWFIENGYEKYLEPRPALINILGGKSKYPYGVDPNNKEDALEMAIEEFDAHYKDIMFIDLINELAKFSPKKNTDLAMVYLWCVFNARSNKFVRRRAENSKSKEETSFFPFFVKGGNGRISRVNSIQEKNNRTIKYNYAK
jgi:hypothetical protein